MQENEITLEVSDFWGEAVSVARALGARESLAHGEGPHREKRQSTTLLSSPAEAGPDVLPGKWEAGKCQVGFSLGRRMR